MPMEFSYGAGLTVDYSSVKADRKKKRYLFEFHKRWNGEIIAYGLRRKSRPTDYQYSRWRGFVAVVGGIRDTVLIDVTEEPDSFAGLPARLGIWISPSRCAFESNAYYCESEEWKLESTLEDLQEVLRKYGSVVPWLYCWLYRYRGDGGTTKNCRTNERRLRIGLEGMDMMRRFTTMVLEVFWLSKQDGVDESTNRRVLYIVTSDVPPVPNVNGLR